MNHVTSEDRREHPDRRLIPRGGRRADDQPACVACPCCQTQDSDVLSVRYRKRDNVRVRRLECAEGHRFTTEEHIVSPR